MTSCWDHLFISAVNVLDEIAFDHSSLRSHGLLVIAVRLNGSDTNIMHTDPARGGSAEIVHLDQRDDITSLLSRNDMSKRHRNDKMVELEPSFRSHCTLRFEL